MKTEKNGMRWTAVGAIIAGATAALLVVPCARIPSGSDFAVSYDAGMRLRTGHALALALYDSRAYPPHLPFLRAPWQALEYLPLTWLPFSAAFLLWSALNLALVLAAFWMLRTRLAAMSPSAWLTTASFLALPLAWMVKSGHDIGVFVFLTTLALSAIKRGHDERAGILLGLASMGLHLLLPALLFLAWRRRWRVLWSVVATGTFLFALSTAVAGPGWIQACWRAQTVAGAVYYDPLTVHGLLTALGAAHWAVPVLAAGLVLAFAAVRELRDDRAVAWLMVGAVIFNWHAFGYDYLAALPALIHPRAFAGLRWPVPHRLLSLLAGRGRRPALSEQCQQLVHEARADRSKGYL
ncbi:MAG TPA: glycosyltransferase family 87 protein [Terriglobia bacterium]|nr:glycosyltransferase family 87 protein [Terriglobia bacterium]